MPARRCPGRSPGSPTRRRRGWRTRPTCSTRRTGAGSGSRRCAGTPRPRSPPPTTCPPPPGRRCCATCWCSPTGPPRSGRRCGRAGCPRGGPGGWRRRSWASRRTCAATSTPRWPSGSPTGAAIGPVVLDRLVDEAMLRLHAEQREVEQLEALDARHVTIDPASINHTGIGQLDARADWADLGAFDETVSAGRPRPGAAARTTSTTHSTYAARSPWASSPTPPGPALLAGDAEAARPVLAT